MCTPTFRCLELFLAPLSQTLTKLYDGVSLLMYFLEWKLDQRFGCALDKQSCTPTFAMVRVIWTPSSPTLAKMHDEVSLLTIFLQLKFDHRFGCSFDKQAYTPTFMMFRAIFTPFKSGPRETTRYSLNFDQFLEIEI